MALMRWSFAAVVLASASPAAAAGGLRPADGLALLQQAGLQEPTEAAEALPAPKQRAKVKPAAKRKAAALKDPTAGVGAEVLDGVKQAVIDAKNSVGDMIKDMAHSVAKMVNDAVGDLRKSVVAMVSPSAVQMLAIKASALMMDSPDDLASDLANEESGVARMAQQGAKKVIKTHRNNETSVTSGKRGLFSGRSKFTEDVKKAIRDIYGMVHETYEGVAQLVKNVTKDIRNAVDPLGQMATGYLPPAGGPEGGAEGGAAGAAGQVGFERRRSEQANNQIRAAVLIATNIAAARADELPRIAAKIVARHTRAKDVDQPLEDLPGDAQEESVQDTLKPLNEAVQDADKQLQVMLSETKRSVKKMVADILDLAFAAGDVGRAKK